MEVETQAGTARVSETESKLPLITLKVLPVLKERQQQHGLRHGDYQRYYGYCSRRLRRLRETLRLPQGDRRHFKKKDVTLVDIDSDKGDSRFLEIPLTLSERAWAYGIALKQDANTEPRKKFHSICRLQKARNHAEVLFQLATDSNRVDARTKLECEAYYAFINATFFFELQNWAEAMDNFKKAQSIYTQLSQALGSDHPDTGIYTDKITELMPSMRFCAYQTGDKLDMSELSAEFKSAAIQALIAQRPKMSEITFRSTKINIPDEKIAGLLARIEDMEGQEDRKVEHYEEILVEVRDAIQTVRDSLNSDKEQAPKAKPSLLLNYLLYLRLRLTNSRTELMIAEKTQPRDCIRLLELILHNYQEMLTIPGLDDEEFQSEVDHVNYIFKARRCQYLGQAYMANKNWEGAFALYGRTLEYLNKGEKGLPANSPHLKTVEKVRQEADQSRLECRARAVISSSHELVTEYTKPETPLVDRLDEFVLDESLLTKQPNIISFPCEFQSVPTKPLFFDLAGHHIKIDEAKVQERAHGGVSPKRSTAAGSKGEAAGLSGFVKGLWGWGK